MYTRQAVFPNQPPPQHIGLVLCCHGQIGNKSKDMAYLTVWDDLARCLAVNGFMVASIRHNAIGPDKVEEHFKVHLNHILGVFDPIKNPAWKYGPYGKPLVLMGQSEGGSGAIRIAKRIMNLELSNVIAYVTAVIGLAPAKAVSPDDKAKISGDYAKAVLILEGTHDGDQPVGGGSMNPYERAAPSDSKHFVWVHGANHSRMLDLPLVSEEDPNSLPSDKGTRISHVTQRLVVLNYVTGFLKWIVGQDTSYRPVFIGDGSFDFRSSPKVEVQNDILSNRLKAFPRYDIGPWGGLVRPLTHPLKITFSQLFQDGKEITPENPPKFNFLSKISPPLLLNQDLTIGILVEWDVSKRPNPIITVPCDPSTVSGAKFIEFQAILAPPIPNSAIGLLLPLRLVVVQGNPPAPVVTFPVFVPIPPSLVLASAGNWTRSIPSTVRIPISAWGISTNQTPFVKALFLDFRNSSAASGQIVLSDFRVTYA